MSDPEATPGREERATTMEMCGGVWVSPGPSSVVEYPAYMMAVDLALQPRQGRHRSATEPTGIGSFGSAISNVTALRIFHNKVLNLPLTFATEGSRKKLLAFSSSNKRHKRDDGHSLQCDADPHHGLPEHVAKWTFNYEELPEHCELAAALGAGRKLSDVWTMGSLVRGSSTSERIPARRGKRERAQSAKHRR